jgi:hypothetical protein
VNSLLTLRPNVEEAFSAKLAMIPPCAKAVDVTTALIDQNLVEETPQINKSILEFPEPRRIRDRDHIRHAIKQPCLICGRRPSDPHHLHFAQRSHLDKGGGFLVLNGDRTKNS